MGGTMAPGGMAGVSIGARGGWVTTGSTGVDVVREEFPSSGTLGEVSGAVAGGVGVGETEAIGTGVGSSSGGVGETEAGGTGVGSSSGEDGLDGTSGVVKLTCTVV